jgi:hypothetical protein
MAFIPNNPRFSGLMNRVALPGRPGVGNTGIVPPSMQSRAMPLVMGTGGNLPATPMGMGTGGGTDPAYRMNTVNTGGPLPATPVTMNTGGPDPAYPEAGTGPRPMDGTFGSQRQLGTGGGGTTIPTTPQMYYDATGQMPSVARPNGLPASASPVASGTTMPGMPRPPTMPTNSQMKMPSTNAQGGRMARPMAIGRPAGGLFPRLG